MICLFTSFYISANDTRNKEQFKCLKYNLDVFDLVFAISEQPIDYQSHDKLISVLVKKRPTFTTLFGIASDVNGGINVICNSDIYFKKDDIDKIKKVDLHNTVLALSRYEKDDKIHVGRDSQDSWIFKGKVRVNAEYEPGRRGSDNALAYDLQKNGKNVINPCHKIKSYHLHSVESDSFRTQLVPQPYYFPVIS